MRTIKGINCYENKDLDDTFTQTINQARELVREELHQFHDEGTCVLGAGVCAWFVHPRCRTPQRRILVHAPFQGNVGSYRATRTAQAFLEGKGIECAWSDGRMD